MKRQILYIALLCILGGCASHARLRQIRENSLEASLSLPREQDLPEFDTVSRESADTLTVEDPEGNQVIIMKAVKDENGEMVATDVLEAARVTARFRNVAERHGSVDLRFQVHVPAGMQDSRWQLRFNPTLTILDETLPLDPILITGNAYRKAQLKGYEHYRKFLASITADSTKFIDSFQLENFLRRNLPGIYRFREDSTLVSEEEFASHYGVTEKEAVEHYTNKFRVMKNRRKIERKETLFARWVKVPIVTEGLRLDTVIRSGNGDFLYDYTQRLGIRPGMRKAVVRLRGNIFESDRQIYRIPESEPLTFYISSISSLTDDAVRYKTLIINRKVEANTACYIEFGQGEAAIREELGNNSGEIARIRQNLRSLLENKTFDLDSIVVTASCSPEGSWEQNRKLSLLRSRAVSDYMEHYMQEFRDSVRAMEGLRIDLDSPMDAAPPLRFLPRNNPENWTMLDALVRTDGKLTEEDKALYEKIAGTENPDARERSLQETSFYRHLREELYPRLRTVRFDFHLHRKGLQKDTVHTTVVDSVYMAGVQAIRDRDYEQAATLLRPYHDYNTAVAFCALDYNASALEILENRPQTDKALYLEALLYSRRGDEKRAVECFLKACRMNPSFIHRGNLDPEISSLIGKYDLHVQDPEF